MKIFPRLFFKNKKNSTKIINRNNGKICLELPFPSSISREKHIPVKISYQTFIWKCFQGYYLEELIFKNKTKSTKIMNRNNGKFYIELPFLSSIYKETYSSKNVYIQKCYENFSKIFWGKDFSKTKIFDQNYESK